MNQILSMALRLLTRRAMQAGRRTRGGARPRGRIAQGPGLAQKIRLLSRLLRR